MFASTPKIHPKPHFGGYCHVELERRRREDRGAVSAEGMGSGDGMGSGEWVSPSPEIFCIFYFKIVSFCACLHGFLFGISATGKCFAEQIDKVG